MSRAVGAYLLLTLTIERVVAVWRPFLSNKNCTNKLAYFIVFFLTLGSCLFYSHAIFGASFFCTGSRLPYCSADWNRTDAEELETGHSSHAKRDLGGVLRHHALRLPAKLDTNRGLDDSPDRFLKSLRERPLTNWLTSSNGLVFHSFNGGVSSSVRQSGPIPKQPNEAGRSHIHSHSHSNSHSHIHSHSNSPAVEQNRGSRGMIGFPHLHGKVLLKRAWTETRRTVRLRVRRASSMDNPLTDRGPGGGARVGEPAAGGLPPKGNTTAAVATAAAAAAAESCVYLIFRLTSWPKIDSFFGLMLPSIGMLLGDAAVAYKVFVKTTWTFVTTSSGGHSTM